MSDRWGDSGVSAWRSEWGNIRSLQEQLDQQAAASMSRQQTLSSQLSKLQGDLSQRVDRLSRAFDAFVELSELRDELTLHSDARRWRIAAKQMVETSIGRDTLPSIDTVMDLPDVAGYWLVPALKALPGVVGGHPDADLLAEAAQRDDVRTTMFLAAASLMMARTDVVAGWVGRAVSGAPFSPVSVGQRALWLAAADGEMAHTAIEAVRSELRRRLDALNDEGRAQLVTNLASFPPGAAPTTTARSNATPAAATEMLRRWASWCAQLTSTHETERAIVAAGSTTSNPAAQRGSDAVLDVVRSLVEEGSGAERQFLDRAEELHAVVKGAAAPAKSAEWDAPAGVVAEVLVADLRQAGETARARFALELLQTHLSGAADELVTQAHVVPPDTMTVTLGTQSVTVGPDGAPPAEVAAAEALMVRTATVTPAWIYAGIGLATIVFLVVALASATGWLVVAFLGAVVLAGMAIKDQRDRNDAKRATDVQVQRVRKRVTDAAAELGAAKNSAEAAATEADNLRRQLAESLSALNAVR